MHKGRYLYKREGDRLFLKMTGSLKFTDSIGLDRLVDSLIDERLEQVLVDLTEVSYIDSTNLGIIARIAEELRRRGKRLTLLSTNEDVNDILVSVGFDKACLVLHREEETAGLHEIVALDEGERERAESMIRAHRSLMDLHVANREIFQDVVDLMEEDAKKYFQE